MIIPVMFHHPENCNCILCAPLDIEGFTWRDWVIAIMIGLAIPGIGLGIGYLLTCLKK
jgi:hypothetical protein